jgi:hypothetical protein
MARRARLLPEAYLQGLSIIDAHSHTGHPAYALGHHSASGWWWYYPFATLVKTPATTIILVAWSLVAGFREGSQERYRHAIWLLTPAVFGIASLTTRIDIGIRQILPIFPFLWVTAGRLGKAAESTTGARRKLATWVLVSVGVLDCLLCAPYFFPYFNVPARLWSERHELLADSNVDVGQDLARLKAYLDEHQIPEIKLSYFGTASPAQVGLHHQVLPGFHLYSAFENWPISGELRSGDLVAISVSNLVGIYLEDKDFYRRTLGRLKPLERVGHSIYIYRIP